MGNVSSKTKGGILGFLITVAGIGTGVAILRTTPITEPITMGSATTGIAGVALLAAGVLSGVETVRQCASNEKEFSYGKWAAVTCIGGVIIAGIVACKLVKPLTNGASDQEDGIDEGKVTIVMRFSDMKLAEVTVEQEGRGAITRPVYIIGGITKGVAGEVGEAVASAGGVPPGVVTGLAGRIIGEIGGAICGGIIVGVATGNVTAPSQQVVGEAGPLEKKTQ